METGYPLTSMPFNVPREDVGEIRIKRLRNTLIPAGIALVAALGGVQASELGYQLVWSDEFDGSGVDPSKWAFEIGTGCPDLCGWGNNELQYYRPEIATVSGGQRAITARD